MSDEQLLRDAALAAGLKISVLKHDSGAFSIILLDEGDYPLDTWNPLTDDGDSLRLAVKLGLFLDTGNFGTETLAGYQVCKKSGHCKDVHEDHGDDQYSATRRAIVRAAAAIGRAM